MVVNSSNGLDPSLVQSFPTFMYSTVKEIRQDTNDSLDCAVCLSEFEDESILMLLTVCDHVFHKECVDLWLESHKTCPVCRIDLDSPSETLVQNLSPRHVHGSPIVIVRESNHEDAVSINIEDSENEEVSEHDSECSRGRQSRGCTRTLSRKHEYRLPRSNSTGHSIVRRKDLLKGQEKYPL